MAREIARTSPTRQIAQSQLTPPVKRRRLTSTAPTVRIGCSSAPTTSAFLIGGSAIRSTIVVMEAMKEAAVRMTIQRLLRNRPKLQSRKNVANTSSAATPVFASQDATFAMASLTVEEVRKD